VLLNQLFLFPLEILSRFASLFIAAPGEHDLNSPLNKWIVENWHSASGFYSGHQCQRMNNGAAAAAGNPK
jgi:hypothetical protein